MARRTDEDEDLEAKLDADADEADAEEEEEEEEPTRSSSPPPPARAAAPPLRPPLVSAPFVRKRRKHKRPNAKLDGHSSQMTVGLDGASRAYADRDVGAIWEDVLTRAAEQECSPERIAIRIKQRGMGQWPSPPADMGTISGADVVGDDSTPPGIALVNYVTDVIHLPTAKTPKLYDISFSFRAATRNQINAPHAELRLGSPEEIANQRAAKARFDAQKQVNDAVKRATAGMAGMAPGVAGLPTPHAASGYPYAPPAAATPYAPAGYQPGFQLPPVVPGESEAITKMRMEMASMMAVMGERMRLEGLQPPPVAAPPPPPPVDREAEDARQARLLAGVLQGMGFTPDVMKRLSAPASLTGASVQQSLEDPLDALDKAFRVVDKFEAMSERMRDRYRKEEEEEEEKKPEAPQLPPAGPLQVVDKLPPMKPVPLVNPFGRPLLFGERGEDESAVDYAVRLFLHNPETASQVVGQRPLEARPRRSGDARQSADRGQPGGRGGGASSGGDGTSSSGRQRRNRQRRACSAYGFRAAVRERLRPQGLSCKEAWSTTPTGEW